MLGVGVYFHPGGNRFEGNFFNNKPVSMMMMMILLLLLLLLLYPLRIVDFNQL